jgi:4a-hydroxytetrahydrobiopterin dehydratase
MEDLALKRCVPCEGGVPPLDQAAARNYLASLSGWSLADGARIRKEFRFKDFSQALAFVNCVGAIAEAEGHHPDILIHSWNKVRIEIWTHAIGGLSENDFILAAKIDRDAAPAPR